MKRRNTIGFLTPFLGGFYFNGLLAGVKQVADEQGLRVFALRTSAIDLVDRSGARSETLENDLAWDLVDGWVVVLAPLSPTRQRVMAASGVPRVSISAPLPDLACPTVLSDNRGGVAAGVRHLLALGHQRIAFVGDRRNADVRERYEGYAVALAEAGLEVDPALVLATEGNLESHGAQVAQQFIAAGLRCSAAVAATDMNALGMLRVLQHAGLRVPEDLALIGFDDMAAAQMSIPPLTTVRQSFDAIGRTAARALVAQIGGQPVRPQTIYVDTALIVRESCGAAANSPAPAEVSFQIGADWRVELSERLVRRVLYPVPPKQSAAKSSLEASITPLIDALAAVGTSAAAPDDLALEQGWMKITALAPNLETLQDVIDILVQAGASYADSDETAPQRLHAYRRRMQFLMMRARIAAEAVRTKQSEALLATHQRISMLLVTSERESAEHLGWMSETTAAWGCLGLWSAPAPGSEPNLLIVGSYSRTGIALPCGQRYAPAQFPPLDLLTDADCGGSSLITIMPVRTASRDWGVFVFAAPMEMNLSDRAETTALSVQLLGAALKREALMDSLAEQQQTLQRAYEQERALASAVRELGCPLIPLLSGVLLVPLIGSIDGARAQQILETVLAGVQAHRAQQVLLDITGVPVVDTHVAATLMQVARAAQLIGAHVTLVGVRPEIAQSIVSLGVDLASISTRATLASMLTKIVARQKA